MSKKTVCIDFDGVIHKYITPWSGAGVITDDMVPGAGRFIYDLLKDFDVAIFSTRSLQPEGIEAISIWLDKHLESELNKEEKSKVLNSIRIVSTKPRAIVYIDDRAWRFDGVFPNIEDIKNFKPWNHSLRKDGGV